jgi:PAS domain S-box-containing protein
METEALKEQVHDLFLELSRTNSILRNLYTYSPDMIWIKDLDGKYIWANSKLIKGLLLKNTLHDIINKTDLEIADEVKSTEHTVGKACNNSDILTIQKSTEMKFIEEFYVNGVYTVLEVVKNVIRDADGNVVGTIGNGRDITERWLKLQSLLDDDCLEDRHRRLLKSCTDKYFFNDGYSKRELSYD